jgi:hypothetical protein
MHSTAVDPPNAESLSYSHLASIHGKCSSTASNLTQHRIYSYSSKLTQTKIFTDCMKAFVLVQRPREPHAELLLASIYPTTANASSLIQPPCLLPRPPSDQPSPSTQRRQRRSQKLPIPTSVTQKPHKSTRTKPAIQRPALSLKDTIITSMTTVSTITQTPRA